MPGRPGPAGEPAQQPRLRSARLLRVPRRPVRQQRQLHLHVLPSGLFHGCGAQFAGMCCRSSLSFRTSLSVCVQCMAEVVSVLCIPATCWHLAVRHCLEQLPALQARSTALVHGHTATTLTNEHLSHRAVGQQRVHAVPVSDEHLPAHGARRLRVPLPGVLPRRHHLLWVSFAFRNPPSLLLPSFSRGFPPFIAILAPTCMTWALHHLRRAACCRTVIPSLLAPSKVHVSRFLHLGLPVQFPSITPYVSSRASFNRRSHVQAVGNGDDGLGLRQTCYGRLAAAQR